MMEENAILRNNKHATKFGVTRFERLAAKIMLNITKKPFEFL